MRRDVRYWLLRLYCVLIGWPLRLLAQLTTKQEGELP